MRTKNPQQATKILSAAARLFATQRFHEARMEDIAATAEVGKGTLYRYFKDKEELYHALLERAATGLPCRLRAEMEKAEGARAQLDAFVSALLGFFDDNPYLIDMIQHAEVTRPGSTSSWQQTRDELFQMLYRLFEKGRSAGEFEVADSELAALLLLGGLRSVLLFDKSTRHAELSRRITDLFLQGADRHCAKDSRR